MKWLFSPGIPPPPSSTSIDVSNEEVLKSSIKAENKKKVKRLATALPIALLVFGCLGFAANNVDFKSSKDKEPSGLKAQNTKDWNHIGDGTPYEKTKLSDAVIPEKYELHLTFLLKEKSWTARDQEYEWEDTFHGKVNIHMLCKERTSTIELHALNLTINSETLKVNSPTKKFNKASFVEDTKTDKWIFTFDSEILPNESVVISFDYTGLVASDSMVGIYKTKYSDKNRKQSSTLASQSAIQNARRIVPCFDEPDKKATWKIVVSTPLFFDVLSNADMEKSYRTSEGEMDTIEFKETPKMSSYLVAVVVGHLSQISEGITGKVDDDIRVYGNAGADKQQLGNSGGIAVKGLKFMEDYTNIKHSMEKLDLVALSDFEAGAMENWGLITFRQKILFFDKRFYPKLSRARTAQVINHEIAHQWFGNLVTLKDWQYTWLNEGFATFLANLMLDSQEHEFGTLEENSLKVMEKAMAYDALTVSQPLTYKLTSAQEIDYNFNAIPYEKGGSILWMVRQLMTPAAFDKAIQDYLQRNQFKNVVPQDLFDSLNHYVPDDVLGPDGKKLNVEFFMRQYTEQSGFPLVTVTRVRGNELRLSQTRYRSGFAFTPIYKYAKPEFGYKWDVPIWYHDGTEVKFVWLKRDGYAYIKSQGPVILNAQGTMYYKFAYERHEFLKFVNNVTLLKDFPVDTVNNMLKNVLDPALLYVYTPKNLMEFSKNMVKDRSPRLNVVRNEWSDILQSSSCPKIRNLAAQVDNVLSYPNVVENKRKSFDTKSYALSVSEKFKMASESNSAEKYEKVLQEIKECGDTCLEEIVDKYQGKFTCKEPSERTSECSQISAEYRGLFYCHMMTREQKVHKVLLNYYKNEIVDKEREHLLEGLLCTNDKEHIEFWLDRIIDVNDFAGVRVRVQDFAHLYRLIAQNPTGRTMILDYFIKNWKKIHQRLQNNMKTLNKIVLIVADVICTSKEYIKFTDFIHHNRETQNMMVFRESQEIAYNAVQWNNKYKDEMSRYFS